jgi:predicted DNA-binding transcriptional regulator YafY
VGRTIKPYERMVSLAAYVATRPEGVTKQDVLADVPGYKGLGESALEKKLGRDRDELHDALGIDIEYSETDHTYRLRGAIFTANERAALIAAAAMVDVEGIGDDDLPGDLGTAVSQDQALVVVRVHGRVVELRDAIADRCAVAFHYRGVERTVDPYVLGMWRNRWYLVGRDHGADAIRKYRLDRIEPVDGRPVVAPTGAAGAFTIPDDLDAEAQLELDPNTWGTDDPLPARVWVDHDHAPQLLAEFAGEVVDDGPDGTVVAIEVRDYESFIVRLLGFGTAVRLLDPPELVARLRGWLVTQAEVG